MDKSALLDRLLGFDEEVYLLFASLKVRFTVFLVGGSSLVLQGYTLRSTHDIDALSVPVKLVHLLAKYDINTKVSAYIDSFPYGFESERRYKEMASNFEQYKEQYRSCVNSHS